LVFWPKVAKKLDTSAQMNHKMLAVEAIGLQNSTIGKGEDARHGVPKLRRMATVETSDKTYNGNIQQNGMTVWGRPDSNGHLVLYERDALSS
jgi:hypothetical protein